LACRKGVFATPVESFYPMTVSVKEDGMGLRVDYYKDYAFHGT